MSEDLKQSYNNKRLKITKIALVFILLCLFVIGRERRTWPIKHWTMYSLVTSHYPSDIESSYNLHVISRTGGIYMLAPWDMIPMDRHVVAKDVIKYSIDDKNLQIRDSYRTYLVRLVNHALPGVALKTIEIWESTWKVEPLALPPLDLKNPFMEIMKDSFSVASKTRVKEKVQ